MGEYEVKADVVRNRIYLRLNGIFLDEEQESVAAKFIEEIKKLKPGFDMINDISGFKPGGERGSEAIKKAQGFAKERGLARIVRVTGSALGVMQIKRLAGESGINKSQGLTASSLEEAHKLLDESS